jgi:trehalose/maltose hydrolase-like predicted phosphorylase
VSLFIKQYYQLTQNRTELAELYPLLEGVADFLVSRVNRTDDQGWLSIETIVGADEVRSTPAFFFPLSSVSLSS